MTTSLFSAGRTPVPGFSLVAELPGAAFYNLLKVRTKDQGSKLWKCIDLTRYRSAVEVRLLELLRQIKHPYLVPITNVYQLDQGKTLILESDCHVMSLRDRLTECLRSSGQGTLPSKSSGVPQNELIRYMEQVADAIDYLTTPQHVLGGKKLAIYHRSLRPDNMLLFDEKGVRVCKISDFGLAKTVGENEDAVHHSQGFSNLEYTPPEFVEGRTAPTSDQFSLAACYYELRTGQLPFTGSPLQQIHTRVHEDAKLELLGEPERSVVLKGLARDPSQRFANCREFVKLLKANLSDVLPQAASGSKMLSSASRSPTPPRGVPALPPAIRNPTPPKGIQPLPPLGRPVSPPQFQVDAGTVAVRSLRSTPLPFQPPAPVPPPSPLPPSPAPAASPTVKKPTRMRKTGSSHMRWGWAILIGLFVGLLLIALAQIMSR